MVLSRKPFSQTLPCFLNFTAALLAVGAGIILSTTPAHATSVGADGAVGVNNDWEKGTAPMWYVELQRQGLLDVVAGTQSEDDAMVRHGLLQLDWAIDHQAADGSFPGSGGTTIGAQFHCTSWFVEAAAHTALLLKTYSPATYTLDQKYYNAEIARLTASAEAGADWLMSSKIQPEGWAYDSTCAHRRYLLASGLVETATLTGDAALKADSLTYVKDGLSRQLGPGWTAAITQNSDGTYPPAILIAPGKSAPANTVKIVSAVGVNPEKSGYDSQYQCVGIYLANVYYAYCDDPAIRKQIREMTRAGLAWESADVATDGTISIIGDSRIGIEKDRSGKTKEPSKGITRAAFAMGVLNAGQTVDSVYATRIHDQGMVTDSNVVHLNGAIGANEAWEHNKALPWYIGNQKDGADYVEEGIARESDGMIQKGLLILNWGFNHQHKDGSFYLSQAPAAGGAAFIEAAARAAHDLKQYAPQTYTPTIDYAAWAASTLPKCAQYLNWLTTAPAGKQAQTDIASSPSGLWAAAAALAETGSYTSKTTLQTESQQFAAKAVALQTPDGEDPENGSLDVVNQGVAMSFALHYADAVGNSTSQDAAIDAADKGLTYESQFISRSGSISNDADTARIALRRTYDLAENLPDGDLFTVVRARLGGVPTE